MSFSSLQRQWRYAAEMRRLKVRTPFEARLADGRNVTVEALLEGFGAARGMLIVSDYRLIEPMVEAIVAAGYGYSCMPQPTEPEISSLTAIDAALEDWGAVAPEQMGEQGAPDQRL